VPAKDQRATLAVVAASAGVSVATVSRVLNGHTDVGADTRARVESLLRQHDYNGRKPGPVRQSPATARVELLLAAPLTAYSTEVMQGVIDTGREIGAVIAVGVGARHSTEPDNSRAWARDLAAAGRQAVITVVQDLTAEDLRALARVHLPVVVVDPKGLPQARVTSVGSTNFAGGLAAAQHLLSLGHRRIAYLGGEATAAHNQARMHGYRAALEGQGIKIPDAFVRMGHFFYQDGIIGGAALLELPEPPTAIFAGSDETAAGVLESARTRGFRIPEDLSVVGFDDTQVASFLSPPLTTVRQPLREMGAVALRTALRLAANEKLDSHHVELATELVVRNSTSAPACRPSWAGSSWGGSS
jgi:LacI family transcriptional regulator